jgi:hypothetical protein
LSPKEKTIIVQIFGSSYESIRKLPDSSSLTLAPFCSTSTMSS